MQLSDGRGTLEWTRLTGIVMMCSTQTTRIDPRVKQRTVLDGDVGCGQAALEEPRGLGDWSVRLSLDLAKKEGRGGGVGVGVGVGVWHWH